MARSTGAVAARNRHKKVLKRARGYYGARSRCYRTATQAVTKAGQYAYRDRRVRRRMFRRLWITRINAAVRAEGLSYSQFMAAMRRAGLALDRKTLSELAIHDKAAFSSIIARAKAAPAP